MAGLYVDGERVSAQSGARRETHLVHEPAGVCGLINPWTYPHRETKHVWHHLRPAVQHWFAG